MTRYAPAKINIFLKITGKRGNYHEIVSRFVKIDSLCDTLTFLPLTRAEQHSDKPFMLEGDFGCPLEKNTVYKAYSALKGAGGDPRIDAFFASHKVLVDKKIPSFAGLGGGSSDAATFLKMANEAVGLGLTDKQLADIGAQVGADVPFFIYDYKVANVEGIGEIVTPFQERLPEFELFTPGDVACDTVAVFQNFREKFYRALDPQSAQRLLATPSIEVLATLSLEEANDLYLAAADLYPALRGYEQPSWHFSGSGSSFFKVKEPHG